MVTKKDPTETDILFPEQVVKLSTDESVTVHPFTFGQTGTALRILAPCMAGIDFTVQDNKVDLGNLNLNVLMYAITQDDCAGAFELVALATSLPIHWVKELPSGDGFTLLKVVFDVAIAPTFDLFKKKFLPEDTADKPKTADGQPSS